MQEAATNEKKRDLDSPVKEKGGWRHKKAKPMSRFDRCEEDGSGFQQDADTEAAAGEGHVDGGQCSPLTLDTTKKKSGWDFYQSIGSPKYVCAPMVDQSELAFRMLTRKYGCQFCYSPMLHSTLFVRSEKYRREMFTTVPQDRPLVVQFCANDPDTFVEAAKYVAPHCDAIDLNLGCPQGIAKRGHYGSFLQDEWDLITRLVSAVHTQVSVPIMVKMRVFDDFNKSIEYAKMIEAAGAQIIAVHGRTRENKGHAMTPADWNVIKAIRLAVKVPVIANGNVRCLEDADEAIRETGAVGVMSAESLLKIPSLFSGHNPGPAVLAGEYLQMARMYPTPQRMIRAHLFKILVDVLKVHTDLRSELGTTRTLDGMDRLVEELRQRIEADEARDVVIPVAPFAFSRHAPTLPRDPKDSPRDPKTSPVDAAGEDRPAAAAAADATIAAAGEAVATNAAAGEAVATNAAAGEAIATNAAAGEAITTNAATADATNAAEASVTNAATAVTSNAATADTTAAGDDGDKHHQRC